MAFLETPRFPENISFGASGGPGYLTDIVPLKSGFEQRNSLWTFPRGTWDVGQVTKTKTQYAPLVAYFRTVGGKRDGFRFKDWDDFQDFDNQGTGVLGTTGLGDGITVAFQMYKNYTNGSAVDQRIIRKPVVGAILFFDNGSPVTPTLDTTTGIATFGSPPTTGHALTWTGQFDVPVRFDVDALKIEIVDKQSGGDLLIRWPTIPIIEIRT
jgi:uncharacterized protein (TIGR02217 family)